MSRIGKKPIVIPDGVKVVLSGNYITVEGTKGILSCLVHPGINVNISSNVVTLTRSVDEARYRAFHGLTRALLSNAVIGVTSGWKKELDIVGVGYKAAINGSQLLLDLGYSHQIHYTAPEGITISIDKGTHITITGIDRQLVGQVAADIRKFRKPEPYKGKGIQYFGEVIRRKAGKTGK